MTKSFFYVCAAFLCLVGAYALGARTVGAQAPGAPGEVAARSGVLNNGETIPLPVYRDGTPAADSECQWIVSPCQWDQGFGGWSYHWRSSSENRMVTSWVSNMPPPPDDASHTTHGSANYLIIATRGSGNGPVPVRRTTWGELKTRYR